LPKYQHTNLLVARSIQKNKCIGTGRKNSIGNASNNIHVKNHPQATQCMGSILHLVN